MDYEVFLQSKQLRVEAVGKVPGTIHQLLFDFQHAVVEWAVRKGRAALFLDTGLGKTFCQLEWARLIGERTLIIAPLAVAKQTVREAKKIELDVQYVRSGAEITDKHQIYITNYEMLEHFDPATFNAVVLDESSILKNLVGKTKQKLVDMFSATPYRLCATATPAPNDITELANHAEFLGVMSRAEMLATFFTYDAGGTGKSDSWRLKKHAVQQFYHWLSSWSVAVRNPSDLGYDGSKYQLPALHRNVITVKSDYTPDGMLPGFFAGGISATDAAKVRRQTIEQRTAETIRLVSGSPEQWIIWTGLNEEADLLSKQLPDAVNVHGGLSPDEKADLLEQFVDGAIRVLVTKTSIAGFGLNMQNCHNMIFFGLDYSWESYYQAVRRVYRFGQQQEVNIYVITSEQERCIYDTVLAKEEEAITMTSQLIQASATYSIEELQRQYHQEWKYRTDSAEGKCWKLLLGDSVERMRELADSSIDVSVYSPPFSDIFVYSATERDLGNNTSTEQFLQHYAYIIRENLRITKPGRLCCVHIADARAFKSIDGYIGRKDLSGDIIEAYQKEGWIWVQRVTVDKNPQAQAIRLKDHGLLFKTLEKDSTGLSGGHADYVLVFKKPGLNEVPVTPLANGEMTNEDWIKWAHPVWYDIDETDVLNVTAARSSDDEKHMCPLQLPLISRCLKLWSNPGETVFSPFAGIGSELYEAVRNNRYGIGIELKPEYYEVAKRNLANAERLRGNKTLFDYVAEQKIAAGQ